MYHDGAETGVLYRATHRSAGMHSVHCGGVFVNRVPADPFSAGERAAVEKFLEQGRDVLGQRELHRIARAKTAIALLQQTHSKSFVTVPELDATGGELTRKLADLLRG